MSTRGDLSVRSSSDESSKSYLDTFDLQIARWEARVSQSAYRLAGDCLYSGSHLKRLNDFLQADEGRVDQITNINYAVLYDFEKAKPRIDLQNPADLRKIVDTNTRSQSQSQLLLLRGYPSPAWLAAVGGAFDVDPEFFDQHLRIHCGQISQEATKWPLLPSSPVTEPRLRFTTSGFSTEMDDKARKAFHVRQLRKRAKDILASYVRDVGHRHAKVGDSILRGIRVHDSVNFSFEQDVSIWTKQTDKGWVAIAWLDFGCYNLADGAQGDSLLTPIHPEPDSNVFRPIVFCRLREMDEGHRASDSLPPKLAPHGERGIRIDQNLLNLWYQYDHGLDLALARLDAFYAMSKLFKLATECERQFLTVMQQLVADEVEQADSFKDGDADMSNLQDHQQVLNRHKKLLRHNLIAVQRHAKWPRQTALGSVEQAKIAQVAGKLEGDFQDLLTSVEDTTKECSQGVNDLNNTANLKESQKAITQAERVGELTRLASVFIPLALLAAIFGMNFREFGQGDLHLWVFVAAAAPVFAISVICLIPGPRKAVFAFLRILFRSRRRPTDGHVESGQFV